MPAGSAPSRGPASSGRLPAWPSAGSWAWLVLALGIVLLPGLARAQGGLLRDVVPPVAGVGTVQPGMRAPAESARAPKAGAQRVDTVEAELVADRGAAVPGGTLRLGLRLAHDRHWHTYWRNPGDSGLPTQLALTLPDGWSAGPIEWPAPTRIAVGPLANYGYEGEIVLPVTVQVPPEAAGDVRVTALAQWLVCKDVCIPGEAALALTLPVLRTGDPAPTRWAELFDAMAARTPRGAPLDARLHAAQQTLSLVFASEARTAEFFPYAEGVVRPAASQVLQSVEGGQRRLDLAPAEEASAGAPAPAPPLSVQALDGVLVLDGRPVELRALRVDGPAPAGDRLSESLARASGGGASGAAAVAGTGASSSDAGEGPAAAGDVAALAVAIGSGLLGGLLLNLMPCVFPVIGLKLLGFAQDAAGDASRMRRHAWAFAAGVVAAFVVLAAALLALRVAGEAVGWGFQLQSPVFVAAMALLFVAIGLNFSGVYEVGAGLTRLAEAPVHGAGPGRVAHAGRGGTHAVRAFGSGMLATLVATPCTAPFMGSAVGFTLGQPAAFVIAVLASVGIGMASPYVLLAHFPAAARRLPRPGRWMESLRQFLAFPMYATAAWLAWVLGQQAGLDAVLRLSVGAVLLALAAWVWGRFVQQGRGLMPTAAAAAAAAAALWLAWPAQASDLPSGASSSLDDRPLAGGAAGGASGGSTGETPDAGAPRWEPYDEARLQALRAQGRTVFVDFTAAWCISCQANKKLVLESKAVHEAFSRASVALLRADWTHRDPDITRALAEQGRNGVPLYLVYRPGRARPAVLPELLTTSTVLRAIDG